MKMDELRGRLSKHNFPRSLRYDPMWAIDTLMGPNVLWLTEFLTQSMTLRPSMRVLDLGCGKATSSIFLAKEFGIHVVATDLWVDPESNEKRIAAANASDRVQAVFAEAHALPFEPESFDAIVSLDAYHYFGTDDLYIGTITKFLKPGGELGIVVPAVAREIADPPAHLLPWWEWDFVSFHSPNWWRRHWEKTGLVSVKTADWMEEGHALWLEWCEITAPLIGERGEGARREAAMLQADTEKLLGFARIVAIKG